jgi:hypothetical protein
MESSLVQSIQTTIEPYIKPREEAAYIRRVLALHLAKCLGESGLPLTSLALAEATRTRQVPLDSRGLLREYLIALNANVRARTDHEKIRSENVDKIRSAPGGKEAAVDHVGEHIALVKLQQKQERLLVIQKYLDQLFKQPAASQGFLALEEVFQGSSHLPEVPREVVNSFTIQATAPKMDLKNLANQLEKVALRAKLLLKREEQLLEEVKARSESVARSISDGAKLHALNTTRNELINWIESELGKASGDAAGLSEEDPEDGGGKVARSRLSSLKSTRKDMANNLNEVKDKYAKYVEARKALLLSVKQSNHVSVTPKVNQLETTQPTATLSEATAYLITPYLENLLSISREQKGLILQKSHFNITLARQLKDTCQMLDHLAEESQLLPRYPVQGASRPKPRLVDDLTAGASEKPDSSARVRAWVSAADSAKIGTLEAVAEKVEEGQVALEGSMKALYQISHLLGQDVVDVAQAPESDMAEEDIWLASGSASRKTESRKRMDKAGISSKPGDVWSILRADLGLIDSEHHT